MPVSRFKKGAAMGRLPSGKTPIRVNVSAEADAIANALALSRFGGAFGAKGIAVEWALLVLGEVMTEPAARAAPTATEALEAFVRVRGGYGAH